VIGNESLASITKSAMNRANSSTLSTDLCFGGRFEACLRLTVKVGMVDRFQCLACQAKKLCYESPQNQARPRFFGLRHLSNQTLLIFGGLLKG